MSIKTTVVGSYPVPAWLAAQPSEQAVADATAVVFHSQELAGLDLVADGELYRFDVNHPETNGMIDYFIRPLENVRTEVTRSDQRRFREQSGMQFRAKPAGVVTGPLGEGSLDLVAAYRRARALTTKPLVFTVTSPYMLARTLLDLHYGDLASLTFALADILAEQIAEIEADVVQIDEANVTGNPTDAAMAAQAINRMAKKVPNTPAVHLCFGNYGGQSIQQGHWDQLIGFCNGLEVNHIIGELCFRGYDELPYFKDLRPDLGFGLGVVDVKRTVVESPDDIARRIEHAVGVLGAERVQYVHPDCGFWMLRRSIADAKMRALVAGRNLYAGKR